MVGYNPFRVSLSRQDPMLEQINKQTEDSYGTYTGVHASREVLVECESPIPPPIPPHFSFLPVRLAWECAKQIALGPFHPSFYPANTALTHPCVIISGRDATGFGVRRDPLHGCRVPR